MKKYLNKKYSDLHWNSYNRLELIIKHIKQLNEDDLIKVRREIERIINETYDR